MKPLWKVVFCLAKKIKIKSYPILEPELSRQLDYLAGWLAWKKVKRRYVVSPLGQSLSLLRDKRAFCYCREIAELLQSEKNEACLIGAHERNK